jgi:microcystin-dependent protein
MSEPFIAEVRIWANYFPPRGWAYCNGQLLSVAQHSAVFALLSTTFGGNGQTNFGVPNLSGRAPMGQGNGPGLTPCNLGEVVGYPNVPLQPTQMPPHTHTVAVNEANGTADLPAGNHLAQGRKTTGREASQPQPIYNVSADSIMDQHAVSTTGSSAGHQNMQPYLAINFCIALEGIFPQHQ